MRVVITEFMEPAAVASLAARFDVTAGADLGEHRDKLKRLLADADALIVRNKTQVDGELLAAAPELKVVGRLGVGLDNIDVLTCKARGIEVIPAVFAGLLTVIVIGLIVENLIFRAIERNTVQKWGLQS